jgi:hypothetical protein
MLDCERWTLTHSSGGAVVLLLLLPLAAGLGSELELAATWAESVAGVELVVVALALLVALVLVVGLALLVALAVVVALGVPDGDADADRDGEFVWPGPPLTLTGGGNRVGGVLAAAEWLGDALLELVEGDGEGDRDGDGDGDGDGECDGDGDGVGVPEAGSAWHTVSVLFVVARGAASALPNTPRVRKLPLSKVTAATLTCAKRIRIACLRCSSGLPCPLRDSEATRGSDGYGYSYPLTGYICITCIADHRPCPRAPLPGAVFARVIRI